MSARDELKAYIEAEMVDAYHTWDGPSASDRYAATATEDIMARIDAYVTKATS